MSGHWFRMHANIGDTKVVWRGMASLGCPADSVVGHLAMLWGKVSQYCQGGNVSEVPDDLLESWAQWRGAPGLFAKFIKEKHLTDGVINDWDEFNGKLEDRREKDRTRKAAQRSAGQSTGHPADRPQAVRGLRYDTIRDVDVPTLGADAPDAKAKPKKERQPTWIDASRDLWTRYKGGKMSHAKIGAAFKPLVTDGLATEAEVVANWEKYLKRYRTEEFASPHNFAERYGAYSRAQSEPHRALTGNPGADTMPPAEPPKPGTVAFYAADLARRQHGSPGD